MEIPHLSFLAVPVLDVTVRLVSTERDDGDNEAMTTVCGPRQGPRPERSGSDVSLEMIL
jgi:hypothetical protein